MRVIGRVLLVVLVVVVVAIGAIYVLSQNYHAEWAQKEAVEQALAAASAQARVEQEKAVAAAVAAAHAEAAANVPPPLPTIDTTLKSDDESRALFPDSSYLTEVTGKYQQARCKDLLDMVFWMRLRPNGQRSTMERQKPDGMRILSGLLTFGMSEFYRKGTPIQTIFSMTTEGPYTTIILGALRDEGDEELVAPQFRLTLYRLDAASFGVVERAPVDEPAAARPQNRAPKFGKVLRRCIYQGGASEL